jgi:hypothetical protein
MTEITSSWGFRFNQSVALSPFARNGTSWTVAQGSMTEVCVWSGDRRGPRAGGPEAPRRCNLDEQEHGNPVAPSACLEGAPHKVVTTVSFIDTFWQGRDAIFWRWQGLKENCCPYWFTNG